MTNISINRITKEMVDELNQYLKSENCIFRIEFIQPEPEYNPDCRIVPVNDKFVEGVNIYPTKEYINILNDYFKSKGIILAYNNSRTFFFSKNGFTEENNNE